MPVVGREGQGKGWVVDIACFMSQEENVTTTGTGQTLYFATIEIKTKEVK